jgi:hypothetical protein
MQSLTEFLNLKQTPAPADASFLSRAEWLIEKQIQIAAKPETVYDVLVDSSTWPDWFPGIRKAEWRGEPQVGAERLVDMGMVQVTEKFYALDRGKQFSFYLSETSLPMGDVWVEDMQLAPWDGGTQVRYRIAVNPKPPLSWARLLSRPILEQVFGEALKNLKGYMEH